MGFCHESHGPNRMSVEERRESFYVHPGYGYDEDGNLHSDRHGHFGQHWRRIEHPEFLLSDAAYLIEALCDLVDAKLEVINMVMPQDTNHWEEHGPGLTAVRGIPAEKMPHGRAVLLP